MSDLVAIMKHVTKHHCSDIAWKILPTLNANHLHFLPPFKYMNKLKCHIVLFGLVSSYFQTRQYNNVTFPVMRQLSTNVTFRYCKIKSFGNGVCFVGYILHQVGLASWQLPLITIGVCPYKQLSSAKVECDSNSRQHVKQP
ncbi:hypothetical protein GQ457_14G008990 [Hibiscus cannabinus]